MIVACCTAKLLSLGCESCVVVVHAPSHRRDGFLCASEGDLPAYRQPADNTLLVHDLIHRNRLQWRLFLLFVEEDHSKLRTMQDGGEDGVRGLSIRHAASR